VTKANVENLTTAHFDCVYPSCGGICCMNGRPAVEQCEEDVIRANMDKFAEHLRPEARALIAKSGFLSDQKKEGRPMLKVSKGWCVFFRDGCVLHKVGAAEGDRFKYKPWRCALFPLARDKKSGAWYVRQRGQRGEAWDLFCLDPQESAKTADATMRSEVEHLQRLAEERRLPMFQGKPPISNQT
jgi:hypothetical protein